MSFDEASKQFLIYVTKRHKKQGFITISNLFNNLIYNYFRDSTLSDITKLDLLKWQDYIYENNYSNKYNQKIYYVFNYFFKYCVLNSFLSSNPLSDIGPFKKKIEIHSHTTYNLFQFYKFRSKLNNFIYSSYYSFLYFYGTRPGEAMALRFSDFKKNKYLCIIHSLDRKGTRSLTSPKNQSSVRVLKLHLSMIFRIYLLKIYYFIMYGRFGDDYYIFGGVSPLSPTSCDRYKLKAINLAKLPYITQHEFRHSFATRMIKHRVPVTKVSSLLGHSNVSTTLDVYVHNEKKYLSILSS